MLANVLEAKNIANIVEEGGSFGRVPFLVIGCIQHVIYGVLYDRVLFELVRLITATYVYGSNQH